jgi:SAM-dependent methyltransferase
MAFRARFDCLWCGEPWTVRTPGDLEGWAHLCPTCLGKAGTNQFLRGRLRAAITARGAAGAVGPAAPAPSPAHGGTTARQRAVAPAPPPMSAFPDGWFLRSGMFERGAIHDTAWAAELDVVTRWLDGLPLAGRILEPAAGVGFFSPLLASKGELHASDADHGALDLARDRLVAHRLRAHLHVADPWGAMPHGDPGADALVAAFLLGRVRGAGLDTAAASMRRRLRTGGLLAVIELAADPAGGPPPGIAWTTHERGVIEAAFGRAGFVDVRLAATGRFFLTGSASAV